MEAPISNRAGRFSWVLAPLAFGAFAGACSHDWDALAPTSAGGDGGATSASHGATGGSNGGGATSTSQGTTVGSGGGTGGGGAPSCADACVAIPSGWTAVIATSASLGATPPTCEDGNAAMKQFAGPAGAPTCSPCQCDGSAATCSAPDVKCWTDSDTCNTTFAFTVSNASTCKNQDISGGSNDVGSCSLSSPGTGSGCSTSGGAMQPDPEWNSAIFTCAAPYPAGSAGGCSDGSLCAKASAPLCVESASATSCPSGFTDFAVAFDDGTDQRSCSTCACSLTCAGGSVDVWDLFGCGGVDVNVTGPCVQVHNVFDSGSAAVSGTAGSATVAGCNGGQAMGSVVPVGTGQKICCR